MRKNIEALINSGIPAYRVSREAGVPSNTVARLFSGESSLDNIRFSLAEKLNEYWEALQMVELDGKYVELAVLASYMDDELRERVNDMQFADDQAYIELYIEYARTQDEGFIEVLASEFGIYV